MFTYEYKSSHIRLSSKSSPSHSLKNPSIRDQHFPRTFRLESEGLDILSYGLQKGT